MYILKKCVFSRIVVKLNSKNPKLVHKLLESVRNINAEALHLTEYPASVQEAALATHKLTE